MIRVCDAIMSSGKTSACIDYMNRHPEKKFLFVTPYLDETERIVAACPSLDFIQPSDKLAAYEWRKIEHTRALIKEGRNIATTHSAFKFYDKDLLASIRDQHYTLFLDEDLETLERYECNSDDLSILARAGFLSEDEDNFVLKETSYDGRCYNDLFRLMKARNLVRLEGDDTQSKHKKILLYWVFTSELLTSFDDVFILTYMFRGQSLYNYLQIHSLEYSYIGISRDDDGYHFARNGDYVPEYVSHIRDLIHIVDHKKLNAVGENRHALSSTWFDNHKPQREIIRKHLLNFFHNLHPGTGQKDRMFSCYSKNKKALSGNGYARSFVAFNTKATNKYSGCHSLAYCVNLHCGYYERRYCSRHGLKINDDQYALSNMIQWIWRSAIRNGEEIYLYLPSSRMRNLLNDWMDSLPTKEV